MLRRFSRTSPQKNKVTSTTKTASHNLIDLDKQQQYRDGGGNLYLNKEKKDDSDINTALKNKNKESLLLPVSRSDTFTINYPSASEREMDNSVNFNTFTRKKEPKVRSDVFDLLYEKHPTNKSSNEKNSSVIFEDQQNSRSANFDGGTFRKSKITTGTYSKQPTRTYLFGDDQGREEFQDRFKERRNSEVPTRSESLRRLRDSSLELNPQSEDKVTSVLSWFVDVNSQAIAKTEKEKREIEGRESAVREGERLEYLNDYYKRSPSPIRRKTIVKRTETFKVDQRRHNQPEEEEFQKDFYNRSLSPKQQPIVKRTETFKVDQRQHNGEEEEFNNPNDYYNRLSSPKRKPIVKRSETFKVDQRHSDSPVQVEFITSKDKKPTISSNLREPIRIQVRNLPLSNRENKFTPYNNSHTLRHELQSSQNKDMPNYPCKLNYSPEIHNSRKTKPKENIKPSKDEKQIGKKGLFSRKSSTTTSIKKEDLSNINKPTTLPNPKTKSFWSRKKSEVKPCIINEVVRSESCYDPSRKLKRETESQPIEFFAMENMSRETIRGQALRKPSFESVIEETNRSRYQPPHQYDYQSKTLPKHNTKHNRNQQEFQQELPWSYNQPKTQNQKRNGLDNDMSAISFYSNIMPDDNNEYYNSKHNTRKTSKSPIKITVRNNNNNDYEDEQSDNDDDDIEDLKRTIKSKTDQSKTLIIRPRKSMSSKLTWVLKVKKK